MIPFVILLLIAWFFLAVALHITVFIVQVALYGLVAAFVIGAIVSALNHLTKRQ
jgi:hypothetical protein